MPYLIDTNVLLRAFTEPNPQAEKYENNPQKYEDDKKLHLEARRAIEELSNKKESLYVTADILKEAKKVAERPEKENGFALTPERSKQLFDKIDELKERGFFSELPKDHEKETAKLLEAKRTIEEAKKSANAGEKKELEKAERDAPHAAAAKAHGVDVLTFNTKHFEMHKDIKAQQPRDVVLDLQRDQVKSFKPIENPQQPEYKNTKTYEVELASGHKAHVNFRGDFDQKQLQKEIERGYFWTKDTINRFEQWKDKEEPVKVKITDGLKPDPKSDRISDQNHEDPAKPKTSELNKSQEPQKPEGKEVTLEVGGKSYEFTFTKAFPNEILDKLKNDPVFQAQFLQRLGEQYQPLKLPPPPPAPEIKQ